MTADMNKKIIAKNIQRLMDNKGISRREFCNALGFKYSTVGDWLNAEKYPRIDKIEAMAKYFGVTKSDLVEPSFEVMAADRLPEEVVPIMKLAAELFQDDPAILDLLTKKASNLYGNKAWAESDITDMPEEKKTMIKLAIKAGLEAIEKK